MPARTLYKQFEFTYSFNNYLKLALCKIIQEFDKKVVFVPSKDLVIGEEKEFLELKSMVL